MSCHFEPFSRIFQFRDKKGYCPLKSQSLKDIKVGVLVSIEKNYAVVGENEAS